VKNANEKIKIALRETKNPLTSRGVMNKLVAMGYSRVDSPKSIGMKLSILKRKGEVKVVGKRKVRETDYGATRRYPLYSIPGSDDAPEGLESSSERPEPSSNIDKRSE